jgi:hypothetical protein
MIDELHLSLLVSYVPACLQTRIRTTAGKTLTLKAREGNAVYRDFVLGLMTKVKEANPNCRFSVRPGYSRLSLMAVMLIIIGLLAGLTLGALQSDYPYFALLGVAGIIAVALSWAAWIRVNRARMFTSGHTPEELLKQTR